MNLDSLAQQWNIVRRHGETDEQLRDRLLYVFGGGANPHRYQRLCYLLTKLGLRRARGFLPIGIVV